MAHAHAETYNNDPQVTADSSSITVSFGNIRFVMTFDEAEDLRTNISVALHEIGRQRLEGTLPKSNADICAETWEGLINLRDRVARLNPDAGEIGAGMLAQLVDQARSLL